MSHPRFSFKIAPIDIAWDDIATAWREADAGGFFHGAWLLDHFYPSRGPIRPMWESWSLLAALAAVTVRMRIGVMVSSNTYRHPALLAYMATTVDNVSGGRLEIGLGAGWQEEEHAAFGIDLGSPSERWGRFAEALEIVDGLLTREAFSFEGRHYRLANAQLAMRPVQRPRPPLVIGGIGPKRTMPLVAKWADHWNYFNPDKEPEVLGEYLGVLDELCSQIGRERNDIEVSAQLRNPTDPGELTDAAGRFLAVGAEHIVVTAFPPIDPDTVPGIAAALAPLL